MSVIIWGLSTSLGGFISGLLMRCMTSYIIVMVVVGLGHIGSVVFLLVWTRQPSLEVICIMACIYGLCHGVIFTAAFGKLCLYPLVAMVLASAQLIFMCTGKSHCLCNLCNTCLLSTIHLLFGSSLYTCTYGASQYENAALLTITIFVCEGTTCCSISAAVVSKHSVCMQHI